ncbi:MAG: hypothetical protein DMG06_09005 [Acidobacteria bacterium]|nr:MAG: hypothetical protein DMG06_09005 [Acidobacteriota bacterium]
MVEMLSPMFQRDKRLVGWDLTARVARLPHAAAESEGNSRAETRRRREGNNRVLRLENRGSIELFDRASFDPLSLGLRGLKLSTRLALVRGLSLAFRNAPRGSTARKEN